MKRRGLTTKRPRSIVTLTISDIISVNLCTGVSYYGCYGLPSTVGRPKPMNKKELGPAFKRGLRDGMLRPLSLRKWMPPPLLSLQRKMSGSNDFRRYKGDFAWRALALIRMRERPLGRIASCPAMLMSPIDFILGIHGLVVQRVKRAQDIHVWAKPR